MQCSQISPIQAELLSACLLAGGFSALQSKIFCKIYSRSLEHALSASKIPLKNFSLCMGKETKLGNEYIKKFFNQYAEILSSLLCTLVDK